MNVPWRLLCTIGEVMLTHESGADSSHYRALRHPSD